MSKYETTSNKSRAKPDSDKTGVVTSFRQRKTKDDNSPIAEEQLAELKQHLRKLEEHIEHLPDIDATKVVELHNRIEAGKYEIDAYRIAEKLAELESELNIE